MRQRLKRSLFGYNIKAVEEALEKQQQSAQEQQQEYDQRLRALEEKNQQLQKELNANIQKQKDLMDQIAATAAREPSDEEKRVLQMRQEYEYLQQRLKTFRERLFQMEKAGLETLSQFLNELGPLGVGESREAGEEIRTRLAMEAKLDNEHEAEARRLMKKIYLLRKNESENEKDQNEP